MRLLSQLGAHPSRLSGTTPVSAAGATASGRNGYLPLPASSSKRSQIKRLYSQYSPLLLRKNRFSLVASSFLAALVIYYVLLHGRVGTSTRQQEANDYNAGRGRLFGSLKPADGVEAVDVPRPEEGLPIRELPPQYPHPPLPRSLAFSNPWPDSSTLADFWLSDERVYKEVDIVTPKWPTGGSPKHASLDKDQMVHWDEFTRPADYGGPAKLEEATDAGEPWRQIQAKHFHESQEDVEIRNARKEWVKKAFLHAWKGYKSQAWGHDEVKPLYGSSSDPFNAWGATIVDSLSTLLVMNLTEEYSLARTHVRQIDFTLVLGERSAYGDKGEGATVPVFETIIRYLGGMLSAYDLTGGTDLLMLERAEELAGWLMGAFNTKYGLPQGKYTLGERLKGKNAGRQVLAEVGSFSLEFGRLAQITGNPEYYDIVQRATDFLENGWKKSIRLGTLLPTHVDDGQPYDDGKGKFSFGAQTDSYYEYLLKASMLFRNSTAAAQHRDMYLAAIESAYEHKIVRPLEVVPGEDNKQLLLFGQYNYGTYWPVLEHLACFAGGMIGMGARVLDRPEDLITAENFAKTCFWAYNSSATGLGPESMTFFHPVDFRRFSRHQDKDGSVYLTVLGSPPGQHKSDKKFQGRPEAIESIFYMWRLSGDPAWQERGWAMFTAWIKHSIAPFGFAGLNNVQSVNYRQVDAMESYVLAETLKYYYLLFSDPHYVSLDEYVFNTEAHPLRLPLIGRDAPASFTPSWRHTQLDEELQEFYNDPGLQDSSMVGGGSAVQQKMQRQAQ